MKRNQSGFSVIELLLIIIAITLIGFVGYYVWHSQQQVSKTVSSTSVTSTPSTKSATKTTATTTTSADGTKYLVIKEWGVKIPYSGDDTLSYQLPIPDYNSNIIDVISKNLATKYPDCSTMGGGEIARLAPTDMNRAGDMSVEQAAKVDPTLYIKLGNYYYLFMHDQAACDSSVTAADQNTANSLVQSSLSKIQSVN